MSSVNQTEVNVLLKMPFDNEINGRLYYQARELLAFYDFYNPKSIEKDRFLGALLDVMVKIFAMKYHMNNYRYHESQCIKQIKQKCKANSHESMQADTLLFELEAFMFQMKSALDFTMKLLEALYPKRFKTHTFGDKGDDLIKGLQQFSKDKSAKKGIIDTLIEMIKNDQIAWLNQSIKFRDSLSHYKTHSGYSYRCVKKGKEIKTYPPRIARLTVSSYLQMTYSNCLEFIQDFMCLVIGLKLPGKFGIGIRPATSPPSVGEPLGQYIKWEIGECPQS